MKFNSLQCLPVLFGIFLNLTIHAQDTEPFFEKDFSKEKCYDISLRYLISLSANYDSQEKWSLLLYLHGSMGRGDDFKKLYWYPVPDNAIFNVASITKIVVTMLTLRLVETEQWDLDETLSDYWVDPGVASDSLHTRLTTRHVLIHQIGFANWRNNNPDKKLKFYFPPGTKYQYSGEGLSTRGMSWNTNSRDT